MAENKINKEQLDILRHSASHIMAYAVQELYPDAKFGIGPSIEDGFYYDIDLSVSLTEDDLPKIEKKMKQIIKSNYDFLCEEWDKEKALEYFSQKGQKYKTEIINELEDDKVTIYKCGDFLDLCRGPHIKSTKELKAVKLTSVAGAYWRGSEDNKMLQRIYGTAFFSKEELNDYILRLEEAKKRDHRKLGTQLGLFSFHQEIGPGLPVYHPKGALLRELISQYSKEEHFKRGYQLLRDPHIMKSDIWVTSGHYDFYKENMFIFNIDEFEYAVKPMNCPGHMLVYKSQIRSYKEFPIRFFEFGDVYRYEKSGVLHGLLRVRGFTQDDAHIFCLENQIVDEIAEAVKFAFHMLTVFGFKEWEVEISTRPEKSIGDDKQWEQATAALKSALDNVGVKYDIMQGEGAFYGPKIDIKLKDAIGRLWQCATVQCDFALPERFDLTYIGDDGAEHRPIMIHRALFGSLERFMGALIEHHAGAFPMWIAPEQAVIIPISEKHHQYAGEVTKQLEEAGLRVRFDNRSEKMQYKIREAQMQKIPYMLVVGDQEAEAQSVAVRSRVGGNEGVMKTQDFLTRAKREIADKI